MTPDPLTAAVAVIDAANAPPRQPTACGADHAAYRAIVHQAAAGEPLTADQSAKLLALTRLLGLSGEDFAADVAAVRDHTRLSAVAAERSAINQELLSAVEARRQLAEDHARAEAEAERREHHARGRLQLADKAAADLATLTAKQKQRLFPAA